MQKGEATTFLRRQLQRRFGGLPALYVMRLEEARLLLLR